MLLPDPLLRHDGPSSLLTALNEQPAQNRWVVHLLHYVPRAPRPGFRRESRDVLPLHDVALSLRTPGPASAVHCVPDDEALPFSEENGRLNFTVPKLEGHQIVEIALA